METNTLNIYLFKALDAYPYELEKAVEALQYALSYDPDNVKALCLMARVYQEQLGDYEAAKEYYERALAIRMDFPEVYPDYIRTLMHNDDFEQAQKLIDFSRTVKGIDKAGIELTQAQLYESLEEYEKAEEALKEARQLGLNNNFIQFVDEMLSRVSKKREIQHKTNRSLAEVNKKEEVKTGGKNWFQNRLNNLL